MTTAAEREAAYSEAVRRIHAAHETNATLLDLGDLPLDRIPVELQQLTQLRVLALGDQAPSESGTLNSWKSTDWRIRPKKLFNSLNNLACLKSLRELGLSDCPQLTDISALANLTDLEVLNLARSEQLTDTLALAGLTNLTHLNLSSCHALADISALAGLTDLTSLNLSSCLKLMDISALATLTALEDLNLSGCMLLTDILALSTMTALKNLNLHLLIKLTKFELLSKLPNLEQLKLSFCRQLTDISASGGVTVLSQINLSQCKLLTDISGLSGLKSLRQLNLSCCEDLTDVSALSELTALDQLDLSNCELTEIPNLSGLTALRKLDLSRCDRITDISGLSGVLTLDELNLAYCSKLQDISPLSGLTSLTKLRFGGCERLADITALSKLSALQELDLEQCNQLTDLSPLSHLSALQNLNLSHCERLIDLSPLARLSALRELGIDWCKALKDISALSSLTELQDLFLLEIPQLTDISSLSGLCNLQELTLYCDSLADISALFNLTNLRRLSLSLPQLVDISVLSRLTALQKLDLTYCRQLSDFSVLSQLTDLRELKVWGCNQLTDITVLTELKDLREIDLTDCKRLGDFSPLNNLMSLRKCSLGSYHGGFEFALLKGLVDRLEALHLWRSEFPDLPSEICGNDSNVLDLARAHFADLQLAAGRDAEVKVFILGNGGVGKTQLCRRLKGIPFDEKIPTTHGIQLGHITQPADALDEPVRLNLWDFGGQDIYHGTHALFLQGRAIFLILWTPEREAGEYAEEGLTIRNRPLAYWLDYVRGLGGTDNPVLILQCQCDKPNSAVQPAATGMEGLTDVQIGAFSSKTDWGLDRVQTQLKQAVNNLLGRRPPIPIGMGRVKVRNLLRSMLESNQEQPAAQRRRLLTRDEFQMLCEETGQISNPEALLNYLHHNGALFYHSGLFDDRIILDQTWALDAIYAIFHREQTVSALMNRGGRFTLRELAGLCWQSHSVGEQFLFLSLMETCGICFPARNLSLSETGGRFEWEYVAPELLPPLRGVQHELLDRIPRVPPDASATASFRYLHEGILRGLLSRLGRDENHAVVYWKFGCLFQDEQTHSQIFIDSVPGTNPARPAEGTISLQAWGRQAKALIEQALTELGKIPIGQPPEVTRSYESTKLHRQ